MMNISKKPKSQVGLGKSMRCGEWNRQVVCICEFMELEYVK